MRTSSLILLCLVAPLALTIGAAAALADRPVAAPVAAVASMQPRDPAAEVFTVDPVEVRVDARVGKLASWTHDIIESWPKPSSDLEQVDLDALAHDIATAAVDDGKPADAAMLLSALAFHEGARFASYVDDFSCNTWMHDAWKTPKVIETDVVSAVTGKPITHTEACKACLPRAEQKILAYGDCDGGRAYTLWQIHPGDYGVTVEQLTDRVFAAKLALSIARRDITRYTTGRAAMALAHATLAKHPFVE
jgi:hypothetical protein